jgi:hypothetical protein
MTTAINDTIQEAADKIVPEKLLAEQKQELFEAIRHFSKYQAFARLSDVCKTPASCDMVFDKLIGLFSEHFEGKDA